MRSLNFLTVLLMCSRIILHSGGFSEGLQIIKADDAKLHILISQEKFKYPYGEYDDCSQIGKEIPLHGWKLSKQDQCSYGIKDHIIQVTKLQQDSSQVLLINDSTSNRCEILTGDLKGGSCISDMCVGMPTESLEIAFGLKPKSLRTIQTIVADYVVDMFTVVFLLHQGRIVGISLRTDYSISECYPHNTGRIK